MTRISIDVIFPVYNGERYIAEAIHSVQGQTYPASQIIVCDDGSTDRTQRIVEELRQKDTRITLLQLRHGGVSAARNAGIKASTAQYIAFLDADDVWLPSKIERQLDILRSSSGEVGFVHSSYFFIDEAGNGIDTVPVTSPKTKGDISTLVV